MLAEDFHSQIVHYCPFCGQVWTICSQLDDVRSLLSFFFSLPLSVSLWLLRAEEGKIEEGNPALVETPLCFILTRKT